MGKHLGVVATSLVVLTALIILNGVGVLTPVLDAGRVTVNKLTTPLEAVLHWGQDLGTTFFEIRDLVDQNRYLSQQIDSLNTELAKLEQAAGENRVLREALGYQSSSRYDLVAAEIISYDYLNISQNAYLDRGRRDGIELGDNVVVSDGILVGVIIDVSERTSMMEPIIASGQVANSRTASGKATGVVRGEHGLGLLFDQVALGEELVEGERVLTSGLGGKFLPNLYIGQVGEIRSQSTDLFQSATIIPATNFRDLHFVFVVKQR